VSQRMHKGDLDKADHGRVRHQLVVLRQLHHPSDTHTHSRARAMHGHDHRRPTEGGGRTLIHSRTSSHALARAQPAARAKAPCRSPGCATRCAAVREMSRNG
jgi:hypothetical protein